MATILDVGKRLEQRVQADIDLVLAWPGRAAANGKYSDQRRLLTDPAFLAAKAWWNLAGLLDDLALAAQDEAVAPFARSVRLAASLLVPCKRFDQLAGNLWTRMAFDPSSAVRSAVARYAPPVGALVHMVPPPDLPIQPLQLELILQRQTPWVVALSADGRRLAVGCGDGMVLVWDDFGHLHKQQQDHADAIHGIAISDDGDLVASCARNGAIRLTRLRDHRWRRLRPQPFALAPNGKLLAVLSKDGGIRLVEPIHKSLKARLLTDGPDVKTACGLIMWGSLEDAIARWQADANKPVHAFRLEHETIKAVTIAASGGDAWEARAWTSFRGGPFSPSVEPNVTAGPLLIDRNDMAGLSTWPETRYLFRKFFASVLSLARKGDRPVTPALTDSVFMKQTSSAIAVVPTTPPRPVRATVKESADTSGMMGRSARLRDAMTDELLVDLQDRYHVWSAALNRRGNRFATATPGDDPVNHPGGRVRLYDTRALLVEQTTLPGAATIAVGGIAVSHTEPALYVLTMDGMLRRRRFLDLKEEWATKVHTGRGSSVAVSPDGRHIASSSVNHTLFVNDAGMGKRVFGLDTRPAPVHACQFISASLIIAAIGTGLGAYPCFNGLVVHDARDGTLVTKADDFNSCPLDVSVHPNNDVAVTVTDEGEIRCVRLPRLTTVWSIHNPLPVQCISCTIISPTELSVGLYDGTIEIRRIEDGELLHTGPSHSGAVTTLDASPEMIVSGSTDGSVYIWKRDSMEVLGFLQLADGVTVCRWHGKDGLVVGCDAGIHLLRIVQSN